MDVFIGTILLWPVNWAPDGWAICDGRTLQVQQYAALYSLIGKQYGGDGVNTFALPDLRGRVPVGMGPTPRSSVPYALGSVGGTEANVLTAANMPAHYHAFTNANVDVKVGVPANANAPTTDTPTNSTCLSVGQDSGGGSAYIYNTDAPTVTMTPMTGTASVSGNTSVAGSPNPTPVSTMQPYQVINYIIALNGIYPTRP